MSKHIEIKIYVKFNSKNTKNNKKYNKDLIMYIKKHIDLFNKCGNFMDLILCDENNDKCLVHLHKKFGIKRLPALIMIGHKEKIYGTPDIKKIINQLCLKKPSINNKRDNEIVHEYQMSLIGASGTGNLMAEDDSPYETSYDDLAQATVETQRRMNQYEQFNDNAGGRRKKRNSKKPMSHRGQFGDPMMNRRRNNKNDKTEDFIDIYDDDDDDDDFDFDMNWRNRSSGEFGCHAQ